jgi:hypothetical protein
MRITLNPGPFNIISIRENGAGTGDIIVKCGGNVSTYVTAGDYVLLPAPYNVHVVDTVFDDQNILITGGYISDVNRGEWVKLTRVSNDYDSTSISDSERADWLGRIEVTVIGDGENGSATVGGRGGDCVSAFLNVSNVTGSIDIFVPNSGSYAYCHLASNTVTLTAAAGAGSAIDTHIEDSLSLTYLSTMSAGGAGGTNVGGGGGAAGRRERIAGRGRRRRFKRCGRWECQSRCTRRRRR